MALPFASAIKSFHAAKSGINAPSLQTTVNVRLSIVKTNPSFPSSASIKKLIGAMLEGMMRSAYSSINGEGSSERTAIFTSWLQEASIHIAIATPILYNNFFIISYKH